VLYGSDGIGDCVEPRIMTLTFDDGPFIFTSHILDLLAQYSVSASFFITGNNNGKSPVTESWTMIDDSSGKGEIYNASLPWPASIKSISFQPSAREHTYRNEDTCTRKATE
jgi:peptidoglycan/xylan/chitin deacetylase (PgdA/CDA1 family)